jgi:hypothetical protein
MKDDSTVPSVPVVIVELEDDPFAARRTHLAFVMSNPQLRSDGTSEEDALERLKHYITAYVGKAKKVKMTNLILDDLIVNEVMDQ